LVVIPFLAALLVELYLTVGSSALLGMAVSIARQELCALFVRNLMLGLWFAGQLPPSSAGQESKTTAIYGLVGVVRLLAGKLQFMEYS
jgi:hypothetical protein